MKPVGLDALLTAVEKSTRQTLMGIRTSDGFRVTGKGRPFVRVICAHFNAYLNCNKANHSSAV